MELINREIKIDLTINNYYNSRGVGYTNKKLLLLALRTTEEYSLLELLEKGAKLTKASNSDTLFV